jgi:hypothetical protein
MHCCKWERLSLRAGAKRKPDAVPPPPLAISLLSGNPSKVV